MDHRTVVIDCFPESVARWSEYAVVAIDVVRATTTAITAVALGRQCFPVAGKDQAFKLASRLHNALLVGELRGEMPFGFDITNSPAALAARNDLDRPAILLSSSGTRLCCAASQCKFAFLACLRNYTAIARHLAYNFPKVALIGAGTHNEFREEDQMCCAWLAEALMRCGYRAQQEATLDVVNRWRGARVDTWTGGKSAAFLRDSGQLDDLEFILRHIDDLDAVFPLRNGEVLMEPVASKGRPYERATEIVS
jgi:2-phosphosulfolactate phosphatase